MDCEMSALAWDMGTSTSTPIDIDPNLGKLCESCNSLNFNGVGFSRSNYWEAEDFLDSGEEYSIDLSIGEIIQNAKEHGCVICKKVVEFIEEWKIQHRSDFDILCDCSADYTMETLSERVEPVGMLVRFMVHLEIETMKSNDCHIFTPLIQFQKCSQPPLEHCDWERGEEQPYSGRIRPAIVDARLYQKWIDTCCGTHGDQCNSSIHIMAPPRWLRLIDVKERCLVVQKLGHDAENYRFVALSYVWGKHKLGKNIIMPELTRGEESSLKEPNSLTQEKVLTTIDDAMTLVCQLGERYLWVDCLCIMQDDEEDQEYFINAMDSIYGCAFLTIVAASGDNANAGLPGICRGRTEQEVIKVKNGISLLQTLDPTEALENFSLNHKYVGGSTWGTRGWTLQEKIFSRRALIFAKEQVYWECQTATWCEDSFWEVTKSPILSRLCFDLEELRLPWKNESRDEVFERYEKLVEEYTGRNLTMKSDRLRAFQGILNALQTGPVKEKFLCGLPLSSLANALTWEIDDWNIADGSKEFPSWSWVRWVQEVKFGSNLNREMADLHFYYLNASRKPDAAKELVVVRRANYGSRRGLLNGFSQFQIKTHTDRIDIVINDIQVQEALSESVNPNILLFFWSSSATFHTKSGLKISLELDLKRAITNVSLEVKCRVRSLAIVELDEFELVVIGSRFDSRKPRLDSKTLEYDDEFIVLICYEKDGILYRMGLADIRVSQWIECKPDWKLICLG